MGSLSQAKTLGGVGSILVLLGVAPAAGPVLAIAGLIMVLIAVKYVSDSTNEPSIFRNMMISVVLSIIGIVVGAVLLFAAIFSMIGLGAFRSGFPGFDVMPSRMPPADFISLFTTFATIIVAVWVVFLISSIFLRKSYDSISTKLNVGMFKTSGLLYLIGAALSIILVGFVVILVAEILQIVAFFSIPDQPPTPTAG